MATKKDFSTIKTGRVYDAIADATAEQETPKEQDAQEVRKPRKVYTAEEAAEYMKAGKTSGRKGIKMNRINMAFYPDMYDYIVTMSRVMGLTMTDFVNVALTDHYKAHKNLYKQAIEFRKSL